MKTKLTSALILTALLAFASACKYFTSGDSYKEISQQELTMLTDRMPDMQKRQLAENQKQREDLMKRVREVFAIAQAALASGLDKTPEFQQRFALSTENLLAQEEALASSEKGTKAPSEVKKEELDAYLAAHTKEFDEFVALATKDMPEKPTQEMIDGQKPGWAEMKIRADRARKAGLDKTPEFALQLRLQRAGMLAGAYQEKLQKDLKPTEAEIKEHYAKNPKSDPEKVKQTAEDVLKRVKAGEDFAALAKEFSDDGSAAEGGKLGTFGKGRMVPEFENAAFSMEKGQISDLVKTKFGYHIIKLENKENRKPKKGEDSVMPGKEEEVQDLATARHILFRVPEQAETEGQLSSKKVQRAIEDLTLKYEVKTPPDFFVNIKGTSSSEAPPSLQLPGTGQAPAAPPANAAPSAAPEKK